MYHISSDEVTASSIGGIRADLEELECLQRTLEVEARQLEGNFTTLFNTINDFLFVLDEEGQMLKVNEAVLRRLGYEEQELLGQPVLLVHPPERRAEAGETVRKMLAGTADYCPVPLISKDGLHIPVETRITLGVWDGKPALFGVSKDITALRLSEEKFQLTFQNNASLMLISSLHDGLILDVNAAFQESIGYDRAEVVGRTTRQLGLFVKFSIRRRIVALIKKSGRVRNFEIQVRRKDGSSFAGLFSAEVFNIQGIPHFLTMVNDISDRKLAEARIIESEKKYRTLMMQSYDAVVLVDNENMEIVEGNRKFEELTGYHLPEASPLYAYDVIVDSVEHIKLYFDELRQNGLLPPKIRQVRTKEGRLLLAERTGALIRLGGRSYQLASFRDVTLEHQRELALHRDLAFASKVQLALLPTVPHSKSFQVQTLFRPKGFVSGDTYYLEWLEMQQILRGYLVDVAGHGIASALQTAAVNVLLHEAAKLPLILSVSDQLAWLNQRVSRYFDEAAFAGAIAFELDFLAGELRYSTAGINEFLFNESRISAPGLFLGVDDQEEFTQQVLPFKSGDHFAFITDGITDLLTAETLWGKVHACYVGRFFSDEACPCFFNDDATAICISVL